METEPKIAQVENKSVKPKIYALLLVVPQGQFLWLEAAYSLENAFGQAKKLLSELHRDIDFNVAKIELFNHEAVDELFVRSTDIPVKHNVGADGKTHQVSLVPEDVVGAMRVPPKMTKGIVEELMNRIVQGNDKQLYQDSKPIFSKAQRKYLEEKLGIKS